MTWISRSRDTWHLEQVKKTFIIDSHVTNSLDSIGRRVCPGWTIASNSLHLLIARVVYCFDFHEVPGHPIPVGKPFDIGTEKPYEVKITVRSPAHAALVKKECAESALSEDQD